MRPISFSGYIDHPALHTDLPGRARAAPAVEAQPDPYILTPQQQMALLTIRRTDLCQEIVRKLMHSTVRASEIDYLELTKRGLIARQGTRRIVTYLGKRRADHIANELARELGLHFFTLGRDQLHYKIFCCCGWSHHYTANFAHAARCNGEWMAKHLRDVGELKATVVSASGSADWSAADEPKQDYPEVPFQ
jgi:hypothetical protein